jgi:hypothetical protein
MNEVYMNNRLLKISYTIVVFVLALSLSILPVSAAEYLGPKHLEPQLSSDGNTLYNAIPAVVLRVDPNPPPDQERVPARFDMLTLPETATATFSITYVPNGGTDLLGETCATFPEEAKAAFNAAAALWGNLLQSSVPIAINACWSNLGSSSILGYSGGGEVYKNFTGAPLQNTWYSESLANALHGSDLGPNKFDMHITYNSNFIWYYGTDGLTPKGNVDLMSVVLHEIAHGLNFSGSMLNSNGIGSWGDRTGYPDIYDTFMKDGTGNLLINTGVYANPSVALGKALTSNNIWFHGAKAMAANAGQRVKMYAPFTWSSGSSYSHLDYDTFKGGENRLMVYAISLGLSTHDPGPVTLGIFKDMGWPDAVECKATINGNLLLHIPNLSYIDTSSFWADLVYEFNSTYPTLILFKLTNYGVIKSPSFPCAASTLSADLKIHIPDVLFPDGTTHLWVDLEYYPSLSTAENSYFVVKNYGTVSN